jgi:hyperosmotically inducible periplasmic protein
MRIRGLMLALALAAAGAVQGCEQVESKPDADDTGRNVRDRDADTLTSGDQSESAGDIKLTQEIRKAVVADDTLSTTAQNVKIITVGGIVTLRGPVQTAEEKAKIAAKAEQIAGGGKVQNQLEVAN